MCDKYERVPVTHGVKQCHAGRLDFCPVFYVDFACGNDLIDEFGCLFWCVGQMFGAVELVFVARLRLGVDC